MDAARCVCGYVFDGTARTGSYQALELAIQEAELYAEYLGARVAQVREELDVGLVGMARRPGDETRAVVVRRIQSEFDQAQAEYRAQMEQVALLRRQADEFVAEQAAEMASARKTQQRERKAADAALKRVTTEKVRRQADKLAAAAELARQKLKAGLKNRQKGQEITRQATPQPPAQKPAYAQPNPVVRDKLAAQAEQALARVRQQQSKVHGHVQTARTAMSGKGAAASPAPANAAPAPRSGATTTEATTGPAGIECPHCTAVVPQGAAHCRCGFAFLKIAEQMPGVGLSLEDQAMLRTLFGPTHKS